ncbi:MAG: recombinase family protein [Elainella sp. C42_A2020_010]|nr:recombinase family protein [Elainella sp. C42_A2020_010]RNJ66536.1 MAG: recombinase family protein [Leptolyngbya sp. IPPAS B-1204]
MTPALGQVFAYTYSDPLLEVVPDASIWGWEVDRVYQDQGTRQQLQQLLQDCRTESVAYLLVRHLNELGDSLIAIRAILAELEALQIQLITTEDAIGLAEPSICPSDLMQLFQTIQTQQQRQQLRRGHARNRLKALPPPGRAPYGYRRGKDRYALDRSTAPVVKDFFDHFLLYGSLRGSVRYLQKKYSKKISVSTGKRWLTSPVYRGDLAYQNGEVLPDTHVPILSREEAAQVDRLLRRNQRMPSRTASAPRSLSGLVACETCGSAMKISRVVRNQQEYLYLRPVACPRQPLCRSLPYQQVLEATIQQICADLPPAVSNAAIPDVDGIQQGLTAQMTAKQAVLDQLPRLVETGVLDEETASLRAYKVRTEIAAIRTKLAQLPPVNLKTIAQLVSIPQFWLDLSEAERRFYFREFIQQIKILRLDQSWAIALVFIF